jgi:hypothetical protein
LPDLAGFLRSQPFLFWAFPSDEVRQAEGASCQPTTR